MGSGFQFLDIIFLALVAAFIILRLRSVLGKRTGHEQRRADPFRARKAEGPEAETIVEADNVVRLPGRDGQEIRPETPLGAGLTQIKLADPQFDPVDFAEKAKMAFEYIVMAFAEGDANKLRPLLSKEVFDGFAAAIQERQENNWVLETNIIRIISAELIDAGMNGRMAYISIKYVTEQVNVTRDAEGNVVEGDADHITEVVDVWTFERNTRSSDPNWTLVATETPE